MIRNNNFDSEILATIKQNNVKPKPRWTFLLKDYFVWSFGTIALILGAMTTAIIIYMIKNNDWEMYHELTDNLWEFIFLTMPYFWLIFFAIFIIVVDYNIKHTKNGYKIPFYRIIIGSLSLSIFLGIIFFNLGLGRIIDNVLGEKISFYNTIINPRINIWNQPDKGRLTGLIISELNDHQYKMIDINRKEWLLDFRNLEFLLSSFPEIGRPIKIFGQKEEDASFRVRRFFYHRGPGASMIHTHCQRIMKRFNGVCPHSFNLISSSSGMSCQ